MYDAHEVIHRQWSVCVVANEKILFKKEFCQLVSFTLSATSPDTCHLHRARRLTGFCNFSKKFFPTREAVPCVIPGFRIGPLYSNKPSLSSQPPSATWQVRYPVQAVPATKLYWQFTLITTFLSYDCCSLYILRFRLCFRCYMYMTLCVSAS